MYFRKTYCNVIELSKMIVNLEKGPTMNTNHYWFRMPGAEALEVSYE
jgi:hypothetical protein